MAPSRLDPEWVGTFRRQYATSVQLESLHALAHLHSLTGHVTIRQICAMTGKSVGAVHRHLINLRACGLVDFTDGKAGTLRPTLTVVACGGPVLDAAS